MDDFLIMCCFAFFRGYMFFNVISFYNLFLCTPIDKTIHNIFYKIKYSFLCTSIDIV